jgi:tetratricopeptide (TPR) repeat protein
MEALSGPDRRVVLKAKRFLAEHGRDTSTARLASTDPTAFQPSDFLCYPAGMKILDVTRLIPSKSSLRTMDLFARYSGITVGQSVSTMLLPMLYEQKPIGDILGAWADLLQQIGAPDAALKYARAGIGAGGSRAALENSIGNILSAQQQLREANEHYAASLSAGRRDGWPELNSAMNFSTLGDLDAAERWFRLALQRRATARSPVEYARYLNEFAWFLATKRSADKSKAMEALTLSEESNQIVQRRNPNYLDTLAECQVLAGKVVEAVKTAEEAQRLVGDNPAELQKYTERLAYFKSKLPQ